MSKNLVLSTIILEGDGLIVDLLFVSKDILEKFLSDSTFCKLIFSS